MKKQSLFPATFSRRAVLAATAAVSAIGLLGTAPVHAQAWPTKMIKLVVPFPAGGPTDTASRIVGQRLSERWASRWWWKTAQVLRVPSRQPRWPRVRPMATR